ncbi:MAG: IclR family transcriptional regulator [Rhizobiales bacterium]|nr:IclR family transcriptional regulator [Hyphomicrobiales bacterium]NRB15454.1 IclR family transcriptional regulator [Hyphomicrobiales bacterium]
MNKNIPSPKKSAKGKYSSPAVDKAVDVIEFLASKRESVSITTISEAVGRSVGEIYRVILALERRRWVYKDPSTDRFLLSLRIFELAHKFPPIERLINLSQSELDLLADKTLQSCHLAVAEGMKIAIIAGKESPLPMHYSVKVGSMFDIFETSSGAVIMANLSVSQQQRYLDKCPSNRRAELTERLNKIVDLGYEQLESITVKGMVNISVPIRSIDGKIIAAFTVPYLNQSSASASPDSVLELLLASSRRLSTRLG